MFAKIITGSQIEEGLLDLGLKGKVVAVHSSLSSFGRVRNGAATVINSLLHVCRTVLMPTYSSIGRTAPPEHDRPQQNGTDYVQFNRTLPTQDITAFDSHLFDCRSPIDRDMGIIPKVFLQTSGTLRSKHPSVSWAANGNHAKYYITPHSVDDPLSPLKKLFEINGYILLLGVPLSTCTALHLAEEAVGRRPFIRWVLYRDGYVHRIREYGCSAGFVKLEPELKAIATRLKIGNALAAVYPIRELIELSVKIIQRNPEITLCSNSKGCRCSDSVKGGPIE